MTTTVDIPKLQESAAQLRGAIIAALGFDLANPQAPNDQAARKLQNELMAVNKQIEDGEATAQVDERTEFMANQHDALFTHERDGFTLQVKWGTDKDGKEAIGIAYTPTDAVIAAIKASLISDRPSSVKQFTYGRDESGEHSFDFGKGIVKRAAGNGDRTTGWIKDGNTVSLADAFKAMATKAEQAEHDAIKDNTSKQYQLKAKVAKAGGYTKA